MPLSGAPVIVTSAADSGPGTLRAAITNPANSGKTIEFAPSVHSITLTSGDLPISQSLDIEGPGAGKLTINGNNASLASASRVFDISGSVTVTIAGLTVANGEAVVTEYLGANGGGGILNEAGATLNLNNCILSNNVAILSPATPSPTSPSAANASYGDVCGGGLLNQGTALLDGTTVEDNRALGGGSYSAPLGGSVGGGIDNWDGGTLYVTNSTITDNEAISAADPAGAAYPYFALGGGLANHAGAVTGAGGVVYGNNNPSTVTITNSTIADNQAGVAAATGAVGQGGGLFSTNGTFALPYSLAVMTIRNSTVSGNRSLGGINGSGPSEFSDAEGGGISSFVGVLTVDNCTLSNNEAVGGNGSTPTVGGVAMPATASGQGGAMVNFGGLATISNSNLVGNKAVGGNSASGPGAIADGGAIANWGTALGVPQGYLTLTNSTLNGNEAIAGQGAADASSYNGAVWGFAAGGGIDDSFSASARVSNCTLIGNQAIGSNGANGGTGFGGGICLGFSYFFNTVAQPVADNSTLQMSNTTLQDNLTQGGTGGASGTGGNGLGGGLAINVGSSATLASSTVSGNSATAGGGVFNQGTLSVASSTVSGNEALGNAAGGGFGGGIENMTFSTLTVSNSTFDANKAIAVGANDPIVSDSYVFAAGGAIDLNLASTGSATISNSTFIGNEALGGSPGASAGGGAISNSSNVGATLTVTGCTLKDNAALGAAGGDGINNYGSGQGGGINSIGTLTVRDSTLTDNLAQGAPLAASVVPSQSVLSNSATAGGGIFCLDLAGGSVLVADSTLTGNQAVGGSGPAPALAEGGGISLVLVPSGLVTGCTVVNNTARGGAGNAGVAGADGVSGGIDLSGGSVVIVRNTTVNSNQAIGGAGGAGANGGAGVGGGINVGTGFFLFAAPDNCSLTLNNCTLNNNEAIGGAGGQGANGGDGYGGGLAILSGASATLTDSSVEQNEALGGQAGHGGSDGQGVGGGVYNDLGTLNTDATDHIMKNFASTSNDNIFNNP